MNGDTFENGRCMCGHPGWAHSGDLRHCLAENPACGCPRFHAIFARLEFPTHDLKSLRELLCKVQADPARTRYEGAQLGILIGQIDKNRPLGSDGKHGHLHTPFCGCAVEVTGN